VIGGGKGKKGGKGIDEGEEVRKKRIRGRREWEEKERPYGGEGES